MLNIKHGLKIINTYHYEISHIFFSFFLFTLLINICVYLYLYYRGIFGINCLNMLGLLLLLLCLLMAPRCLTVIVMCLLLCLSISYYPCASLLGLLSFLRASSSVIQPCHSTALVFIGLYRISTRWKNSEQF